MRNCNVCNGRLKRVHRTFFERIRYLAIYECQQCEEEEFIPRRYNYHFGVDCRCPKCGTYRLVKLKERDKIDPLHTGFLHLLERLANGKLYHCCFCRLQFYDRRELAERTPPEAEPVPQAEQVSATTRPGTARSGG